MIKSIRWINNFVHFHYDTVRIILCFEDRKKKTEKECLIVCVEILRPSQPNGVMSSAVNLPNHTFTW